MRVHDILFLFCRVRLVSEIQCSFSTDSLRVGKALLGVKDVISARLKKPEGFKGHPLFADDRSVDPLIDPVCQIRPDLSDVSLLTYNLLVTDFTRCGVLRRNVSYKFSYIVMIYYILHFVLINIVVVLSAVIEGMQWSDNCVFWE